MRNVRIFRRFMRSIVLISLFKYLIFRLYNIHIILCIHILLILYNNKDFYTLKIEINDPVFNLNKVKAL